jgi:mutual gliding-motility protein MglA
MAYVNFKQSYVRFKIVYYGPALSGKTTNLEHIHSRLKEQTELVSLDTDGDRTIFFDYMPLKLGKIGGIDIVYKLYTVPGQVRYNKTRKMVLRDVDGVIFVADAQEAAMPGNLESLQNLRTNLEIEGVNLDDIPYAIQYNKWDLPGIASLEDLEAQLNPRSVPSFTTCATTGQNIKKTLSKVADMVYKKTAERHGLGFSITDPPPPAPPDDRENQSTGSPAASVKVENPPNRPTERTPPPLHMPREDNSTASTTSTPEEPIEKPSADSIPPVLKAADDEPNSDSIPPVLKAADDEPNSDSIPPVLKAADDEPNSDSIPPVLKAADDEPNSDSIPPVLKAADDEPNSDSIPQEDEDEEPSGEHDSIPDQTATIPPPELSSDSVPSSAAGEVSITDGDELRSVIENMSTSMSHGLAEIRDLLSGALTQSKADTEEAIQNANQQLVVINTATQAGMSHLAKEVEYLKKTVDDFRRELDNAMPNKVDNQLENFLSETSGNKSEARQGNIDGEAGPTVAPRPVKK